MRLRITKPHVATVGEAEVEVPVFSPVELAGDPTQQNPFGDDYTLAQSHSDFCTIIDDISHKGWKLGGVVVKRGLKSFEYHLAQNWGIIGGHFRIIPIDEETYKPLRVFWLSRPANITTRDYFTRENPRDLILIQRAPDSDVLNQLFLREAPK